jgi:hypothetical protein
MKSGISLIFIIALTSYSCNKNTSNEKRVSICISYRPLNSICLLEERDSIRVAYQGEIRPIDDNTDCIISLPSVFHKGQEFIPVGYLYYNADNLLVKAKVVFTLGNNPGIDTIGIRSKLMQSFSCDKNIHHSYTYNSDTSLIFKSFDYQMK